MLRSIILILVVSCIGFSCHVYAQDAGAQAKALAAALDKNKYKKKEKKNFTVEIYIDIKNEPVVKNSVTEYAGVYASDGYRLDLKVAADGAATGSGYDAVNWDDNSPKLAFTLKDARVQNALLTGTKVFENGVTEKFEAVFVNRTVVSGKNAATIEERNTSYGLGFIQTGKDWTNRAFLEKRD